VIDIVAQLHFIRPLWLLTIPLIFALWWMSRQTLTRPPPWTKALAPHLADALILNKQKVKRIVAVDVTAVIMLITCLCASGPSWNRVPNPFFSETAPLAIALNVNQTMLTNDIQPTRLARAKIKIQDLLAIRSGARTALVAYAGSAHMVLPLTEDPDLLKPFLNGLTPGIMPVKGNDASLALNLAHDILTTDETPGSILFVTDDISETVLPAFAQYQQRDGGYSMVALIVGTEKGGNLQLEDGRLIGGPGIDKRRINQWQRSTGIRIVDFDTGEGDLRQISRIVASNLQASKDQDERSEWLDQGWWLLWPVLLLMLISFRRGWTIVWR